MGVEVSTARVWHRAEELGLSRVVFVNMLDRERADFYRALERCRSSSRELRRVHLPIGTEHELTGIVDLLHMCAYMSPEGQREGDPAEIPAELADQAAEYREKLLDAVVETDEALMERYLEGEELVRRGDRDGAEGRGHARRALPGRCGVATKNLGTTALLDLLVEGVPSPAKKGVADRRIEGAHGRVRVQDRRRPVRRPDQRLPRLLRARSRPTRRSSTRATHAKERIGAADGAAGQGARRRPTRSARATSARSRS